MFEAIQSHPFFGIFLTLFFYALGMNIHKKWKSPLTMPLVIAIVLIVVFLSITKIPYEDYYEGGKSVGLWITPATVALALKLEQYYETLKANFKSILMGIVLGVVTHTLIILVLVKLFGMDSTLFVTIYPKSVTTAIALGVSESLGGYVALTVSLVVFTGIVGAMVGPYVFKTLKIKDPIAQGISIGTAAHAIGTTKAIEIGPLQGAMSGLAITVTGVITVLLTPLALWCVELFF